MNERAREASSAYLFILPNVLGFLVFTSLPVLASLCLAFVEWDIITPPKFVGLANVTRLLGFHLQSGRLAANDPLFWKYLYNTVFLMAIIPFSMFGSLLLAAALHKNLKGAVLFRTVFFLPTVCSGVALCFVWQWMLSSDVGLINAVIRKAGNLLGLSLHGPDWLTSTKWAKPALMLMALWTSLGGTNMVLYLAALSGIPSQLYEAADIDGASSFQKFWRITIPLVSPTSFFIFIMSVIGGFQGGFLTAYNMTRGGPAGSTTTIEYYIYTNAYQWFRMGYASAIAWFLFLVILVVTVLNWKLGGSRVHYH